MIRCVLIPRTLSQTLEEVRKSINQNIFLALFWGEVNPFGTKWANGILEIFEVQNPQNFKCSQNCNQTRFYVRRKFRKNFTDPRRKFSKKATLVAKKQHLLLYRPYVCYFARKISTFHYAHLGGSYKYGVMVVIRLVFSY